MPIGNGGIIGPANVPTITTASGVWSLREQQQAQGRGAWPLALEPDPYFEYTTLLLPGNGTNGANNNTFLDGSTNNFNITRNGNTTQGTFSPFSQTGWGNYFDGNGDYLYVNPNSALDLQSGVFTIELWAFRTSSGVTQCLITNYESASTGYSININASNKLTANLSGNVEDITGTTDVPTNQWFHVALSGTPSSSVKLFLNGGQEGSTYTSTTAINSTRRTSIGAFWYFSDGTLYNPFTGYISNLRILKGTALYTTPFTPPTAPLTAITNTSLLTCQSNRFIDNSSNNFTITRNGDTRVVAFSPFNPTLPWIASINGGSGYFDGSGDALYTPNTGQFAPTGDFTIGFWVYPITLGVQVYLSNYTSNLSTDWSIETTASGTVDVYTNGSTRRIQASAGTLTVGAWFYIALVRSSNIITLYVNGVSKGTYTQSGTFGSATKSIYIGANTSLSAPSNSYISDVILIDGTPTTTVPTQPSTAVSGTRLLLNFTNAGIYDATGKNNIETVNDARISTAIAPKWGNGSILLQPSVGSTQDYLLSSAPLSELAFLNNGSPWTVEGWFYTGSTSQQTILSTNAASASIGMTISINSPTAGDINCSIYRGVSGSFLTATSSGSVWNVNTWNYFAVVLDASKNLTIYINGSQVATTSGSSFSFSSSNPTYPLVIGRYQFSTPGAYFNGYLQDIRITRGIARTITTPTTAFPTL